jgi:hypothetical protein
MNFTKPAKLVPFLSKLHRLTETCPKEVGRWSMDGRQFDILNVSEFNTVLKTFYPSSTIKTFFRQLFYYGFTYLNISNGGGDEVTKGTFSFRHACFLRDSPSLIYEIKRNESNNAIITTQPDRVEILEKKVNALQSMVDDLSRKISTLLNQNISSPLASNMQPLDIQTKPIPSNKRIHDAIDYESDFESIFSDFSNSFPEMLEIRREHSLDYSFPKSVESHA